ncbi:MAG: hypothetical protein OWR52_14190 [Acidibacillus sp.]|nr:hypothetical protein [Acidibacillus sp.]
MDIMRGEDMGKLLDGNVFASMRIILPEHREKMRDMRNRRLPSIDADLIDDEKYMEMQEIVEMALNNAASIEVKVRKGKNHDIIYQGIPKIKGERLYIGSYEVPMRDVIDMRRLD